MKKTIIIALLVIVSTPLFSQTARNAGSNNYDLNLRQIELTEKDAAFGLTEEQFKATIGSPYSNEDFLQGKIFKNDELVKTNVAMRYNLFSDEIEIKKYKNDETYGALLRDPDVFVKIFNDIYVFIPFEGSNEKGHYFKVSTEGKNFNLYTKESVVYKPPYFAKSNYEISRPAEWSKEVTYYLASTKGELYELPNSKSKIIKAMGSKSSEIKSFIKKNRLDLDAEDDLVKLVDYYNSIL